MDLKLLKNIWLKWSMEIADVIESGIYNIDGTYIVERFKSAYVSKQLEEISGSI